MSRFWSHHRELLGKMKFSAAHFYYWPLARDYVFSQHFLRIVSGDPDFPGAYLFAFMRSEAAFRILRSMSTGSKQQDIHEVLRQQIPVPECTPGGPGADRGDRAGRVPGAGRGR